MNLIFDFGNVLVRWEPERVFLPYFGGDEAKYWYFWRHVCDADFRNRIDAGDDPWQTIHAQQRLHPDYAEPLAMYFTHWDEALPGEMPGMRQLVMQLKDNPNCRLYGLTNWSMATFPAARAKFPILQLIDNYVVSGDVKMIKPDAAIFQLLTNRFGLRPEESLFIDDNPMNIEGARRAGIDGIVFTGADNLRQSIATHLQP